MSRNRPNKPLTQLAAIQSVRKALPPATRIYADKRRKAKRVSKRLMDEWGDTYDKLA